MFFHLYEGLSGYQLIGWVLVFVGLVVANELARRTKAGGIFFFGIVLRQCRFNHPLNCHTLIILQKQR